MPKAFRECGFCDKDSYRNVEIVFFSITQEIRYSLKLKSDSSMEFICENHFKKQDMKLHGLSKRLVAGAIPSYFPRKDYVLNEHDYFKVETEPIFDLSPVSIGLV